VLVAIIIVVAIAILFGDVQFLDRAIALELSFTLFSLDLTSGAQMECTCALTKLSSAP
jgi:hypothetical protein